MELAVGWFVASCLSHPPINQTHWSFALCLAQTNWKSSDFVLRLLSCQKRPPMLIYSCFIQKLRKIIPNPWNQAFPKSCYPLSVFKCEKVCLCQGIKKMVFTSFMRGWGSILDWGCIHADAVHQLLECWSPSVLILTKILSTLGGQIGPYFKLQHFSA